MIKALAHDPKTGRKIFIFGFSHDNLVRLLSNDPIRFPGEAYGLEGDFLFLAGETEEDMANLFDPTVNITTDPNPT